MVNNKILKDPKFKICEYFSKCKKRVNENNLCFHGGGNDCGYWRYLDELNIRNKRVVRNEGN